jgi:ABC-type glycerol-3-phosphate transport system substrate-binding protein
MRPFMLKGLALPLDRFIRRDWKASEIDDFYKGPFDAFEVEGKQEAIPVYINTNIVFVNKNLLQEAGLPYPKEDWNKQQFLDYAIKLTRPNGERWGYDMSFTGLDRNVTWMWNNDGQPHDPQDGPIVTKLTYDDPLQRGVQVGAQRLQFRGAVVALQRVRGDARARLRREQV